MPFLNSGWLADWPAGLNNRWMGGSKICFMDCLQQSTRRVKAIFLKIAERDCFLFIRVKIVITVIIIVMVIIILTMMIK